MIELNNISLSYGEKILFENFSLSIAQDEKVLLNAKSGRGKSTLLRILLGFENSYSGTVIINSIQKKSSSVRDIRRHIAYVSQDIDIPPMSVGDFLSLTFSYSANSSLRLDHERYHELTDIFALPADLSSRQVSDLSGGERQRLGIITALLLDRPILLLDEPTAALDGEMKEKVIRHLTSLQKTVLIVSHDEIWQKYGIRKVEL